MSERKPLTKIRSKWAEIPPPMSTPYKLRAFRRHTHDGLLVALSANEPEVGWHLSVSFRDHKGNFTRYPSWDELADARDQLLPKDMAFIMRFPVAEEYVAMHDTTFHLYQEAPATGEAA